MPQSSAVCDGFTRCLGVGRPQRGDPASARCWRERALGQGADARFAGRRAL